MDQGISTSDDYKNYVQFLNRGAVLKPYRYRLTVINHQATVHKKTLVIMAVMHSFALRPKAARWLRLINDSNKPKSGPSARIQYVSNNRRYVKKHSQCHEYLSCNH
jgi:hypothetical protein